MISTRRPRAIPLQSGRAAEQRDGVEGNVRELFRAMYTSLSLKPPEVIAVCSALPGEGKTTVCTGLGATFAEDFPHRRVAIVETDLQHPVLAEDFGVYAGAGLAEWLAAPRGAEIPWRQTHRENLRLLPAGSRIAQYGRLLRSEVMTAMVAAMREDNDLVLLDVPALLENSDAAHLISLTDGVLWVVKTGDTPSGACRLALGQLNPAAVRGVVLNSARSAIPGWLTRLIDV